MQSEALVAHSPDDMESIGISVRYELYKMPFHFEMSSSGLGKLGQRYSYMGQAKIPLEQHWLRSNNLVASST